MGNKTIKQSWVGRKETPRESHDGIAAGLGQGSIEGGRGQSARVFRPFLATRVHSASALRLISSTGVSQPNVTTNGGNRSRLVRPATGFGPQEDSQLLDALLCPKAISKKGAFSSLLSSCLNHARQLGLINARPEAAIDATGLDTEHASYYYAQKRSRCKRRRRQWPKLTVVCHTQSHLFVAAVVSKGPSNDSGESPEAMTQATQIVKFDRLLADSGYDSEDFHALCRQRLGVRLTVIKLNRRRAGRKWPTTRYRCQMKRRFLRRIYGNRWQVESAFSRHKRLLGPGLRSRTLEAQQRECLLRVLTHNLMLIRLSA